MKRVRYTISMLSEDKDIVEYLDKIKSNRTISSYIRYLIRQDMHDSPLNGDFDHDQLADKIVRTLIKNDFSLPSQQGNSPELLTGLENKSIIDNLF